ncbi:MAG: MBOAT family protein, partial [Thermoguttaceae bacterium]|nr:MBOAT family protein [Thermoguttaceae bacterium]
MLFNSFTFPVFLLIVLSLYYCLARRWQNLLLLLSSYLFYAWWDWRFVALLLYVTFVNYLAGLKIAEARPKSGGEGDALVHSPREKFWLWTAVAISLGLLGFFKYFNFFADSLVHLLNVLGFGATPFALRILLPVGISFFTFQALAYTIDIYRGKETVQRNFPLFALYISFFPQLVAGPIERSTRLIPQLKKRRVVTKEMIASASQLILVGYFKKIFLADGVAPVVNSIFEKPDGLCGLALLMGAYLLALQIYGDFSGYTDIARGVARLFGIELCLNFRQPYFASNITDFWRRWHISLSTWLRDYLYIPLGGNRKGKGRTYRNLMLTMLLGGLWHGANWTFVAWGGLHGLFLMAHKFIL